VCSGGQLDAPDHAIRASRVWVNRRPMPSCSRPRIGPATPPYRLALHGEDEIEGEGASERHGAIIGVLQILLEYCDRHACSLPEQQRLVPSLPEISNIAAFATRAGYELVGEFYDAAVSGADAIDTRPGFAAMLERIEGNGVRTIIDETASRFARDLMVQEVGHAMLQARDIDLVAADNPGSFLDDTPTAKLVRQVLGAISEFDKAMTVAKLRGARERKRRDAGKCEGRKSHAELNPALVATAKRLRRHRPKGGRMSLRAISAELAAQGFLNERGRPFSAASVNAMLGA
jgi:DNA invertase Pin-like site-specific DNA recombinase